MLGPTFKDSAAASRPGLEPVPRARRSGSKKRDGSLRAGVVTAFVSDFVARIEPAGRTRPGHAYGLHLPGWTRRQARMLLGLGPEHAGHVSGCCPYLPGLIRAEETWHRQTYNNVKEV
jgi:hypothetical protein